MKAQGCYFIHSTVQELSSQLLSDSSGLTSYCTDVQVYSKVSQYTVTS